MSFQEKYLKYKSKYLDLKNQIGGTHGYKVDDEVIINGTIILTNPEEYETVSEQKAVIVSLLPPHNTRLLYIVRLIGCQFNDRIAVEINEKQIKPSFLNPSPNFCTNRYKVDDRVLINGNIKISNLLETKVISEQIVSEPQKARIKKILPLDNSGCVYTATFYEGIFSGQLGIGITEQQIKPFFCNHRCKVGDGVLINGNIKLTLPLEDKIVSEEPAYIENLLPPGKD
jgi:hypothetical protein